MNPANITILIVDDSVEFLEVINRNLQGAGYKTHTATNVQSAIAILDSKVVDMVITDLRMPGQNGTDLIRHVSENFRNVGVLVVTGFPSIEGAVESIKIGAEEYLVKSFTDEELLQAVRRVISKLKKKKDSSTAEVRNFGIIGQSTAMKKVFSTINKVKDSRATVLIQGESGTGKELVARALHYGGATAKAPFVPVNCGGIPDSLLESELFGHVKGAFTGATETRSGFFQTAEKGTIFLDEISNTSLAMQAKLLRVLQEKEVYMVGSKKPQKIDVRVVAATNVSLHELVKKGLFREDLYYRLNIICIDLPPLREREDDIDHLIDFFLKKYSGEANRPLIRVTQRAMRALRGYKWPGNIRELQNLLHRAAILLDEPVLDVPDLPDAFRYSAVKQRGFTRSLQDVERDYIQSVMEVNNGNISRSAKILGIDRKTLRERLKRFSE